MANRSRWYSLREALGNRLSALGKSIAADTQTELPPQMLRARQEGELASLPQGPGNTQVGSDYTYNKVRQELAPFAFNPYGFEDPNRVVAAVTAHMGGQFQQSGLLSQALNSDPKILGPLSIRTNALAGLPRVFTPPNDSPRAKDLADLFRARWRQWMPVPEQAKFTRDLILMGFTRGQTIFNPAARLPSLGLFREPETHAWMPGQYIWWYWDPQRNFGRWLQSDKTGTIEPCPGDGQWVFVTLTTKQPWNEGLILSLGLRYAMRLSIALNMTRFATALASGHNCYSGPVQLDGKSQAYIQAQLADPDNLNLLLPSGSSDNKWDVKWVGPNSSGAKDLFLGALEEQGMECSEVILGQNLTTEVKKGSFAAAKSAQLVRQDVLEFDALTFDGWYYDQVARPVAAVNFNDADLAPHVETIAEPATDAFLLAHALADLSKFLKDCPPEILNNIDVGQLLAKFKVPLTTQSLDLSFDAQDQVPTPRLRAVPTPKKRSSSK